MGKTGRVTIRRKVIMQIGLNDSEREILHRLVKEHCTTLSHEIHKTDTREFRQRLEAEDAVCRGLLEKLGAA
jgi:hypothetical protein